MTPGTSNRDRYGKVKWSTPYCHLKRADLAENPFASDTYGLVAAFPPNGRTLPDELRSSLAVAGILQRQFQKRHLTRFETFLAVTIRKKDLLQCKNDQAVDRVPK